MFRQQGRFRRLGSLGGKGGLGDEGEMRDLLMLNISLQEWSASLATEVSAIRVRMREV